MFSWTDKIGRGSTEHLVFHVECDPSRSEFTILIQVRKPSLFGFRYEYEPLSTRVVAENGSEFTQRIRYFASVSEAVDFGTGIGLIYAQDEKCESQINPTRLRLIGESEARVSNIENALT